MSLICNCGNVLAVTVPCECGRVDMIQFVSHALTVLLPMPWPDRDRLADRQHGVAAR